MGDIRPVGGHASCSGAAPCQRADARWVSKMSPRPTWLPPAD